MASSGVQATRRRMLAGYSRGWNAARTTRCSSATGNRRACGRARGGGPNPNPAQKPTLLPYPARGQAPAGRGGSAARRARGGCCLPAAGRQRRHEMRCRCLHPAPAAQPCETRPARRVGDATPRQRRGSRPMRLVPPLAASIHLGWKLKLGGPGRARRPGVTGAPCRCTAPAQTAPRQTHGAAAPRRRT
jgi:hypothetical protein